MIGKIQRVISILRLLVERLTGLEGMQVNLLTCLFVSILIILFIVLVGKVLDTIQRYLMMGIVKISSVKMATIITMYLTFPGVMVHELNHALMCLVTGAKILKITLFHPDKQTGVLGSVKYMTYGKPFKQRIQLSFISSAPVLFGYIDILVLFRLLVYFNPNWLISTLMSYLIISIFLHMTMSSVDIKHYFKGALFILPVVYLITYYMVFVCIMRYTGPM